MLRSRLISVLLLALYLPACTTLQPLSDPVGGLQPAPKPVTEARITLRSGDQMLFKSPKVVGDSILGTTKSGARGAVALADVSYVEAPRTNGVLTAFFVLGVAGLTLLAGVLIHSAT